MIRIVISIHRNSIIIISIIIIITCRWPPAILLLKKADRFARAECPELERPG